MICLRCGYCCVEYMVILPDGQYKPSGVECPNLDWDEEGKARCTIYGQSFFIAYETVKWEDTPCGQYSQIEATPQDKCRMGAHLLGQGKNGKIFIK